MHDVGPAQLLPVAPVPFRLQILLQSKGTPLNIKNINTKDISFGERFRKDLGDLEKIAHSIESEELHQPIGVTPDNQIVFGVRRFLACRDILGWKTIPAKIVPVEQTLTAQISENLRRKDYTVSERVAIVDFLRGYAHGGDRKSDQRRNGDVEKVVSFR